MAQHLLAMADHATVVALQDAGGGILQKIGKAIFAFLAGIFVVGALIGLLLGFFIGRAVGRKQGTPAPSSSSSELEPGQP